MDLPVQFPRDPYCRADTRLMLCADAESGDVFIGLTPDGAQPGRDKLSRLTLLRGEEPLRYTFSQEDGALVLRAEGGFLRLSLGKPERLIFEGEGVSLLIGKGKAAGAFMGGGSAVDDARPGAYYVASGARMRILPKTGSAEVRSAWNLNALSDPDPRIVCRPDESGRLEGAIYVSDFDCAPADEPAPEAGDEFAAFLDTLAVPAREGETLHAAYIVWSVRQPVRALAAPQIDAPVYVSNRRDLGTARLSDNVLLAAFLADPKAANEQLCSFLRYMDDAGLVPSRANNRTRLYEAEIPFFGAVYRARPDIKEACGEDDFDAQLKALGWWRENRFCSDRGLFFYLHRFEPGLGKRARFADAAPEFSPDLNICLVLWAEALADIAARLGRAEAADLRELAEKTRAATVSKLWDGKRWRCLDINDAPQDFECGRLAALDPSLPGRALPERVPAAYALPLLLAGGAEAARSLAPGLKNKEIKSLRQALTLLAAAGAERGSFSC
jgi:hypothetical protein